MGLLSVAVGAFGAHALRASLTASGRTDTFETAVKYHFYHALALLAVGILLHIMAGNPEAEKWLTYAGYSFLAGVVVFSGSLYVLCATGITVLGAITPLGGLMMIAGWAMVFWAFR